MSKQQFFYNEGDTLPALFWKIAPAIDLTTAVSVTFSMEDTDGNVILDDVPAVIASGTFEIDDVATVFTPADGVVYWAPSSGDTDSKGVYRARFRVNFPASKSLSSPQVDYIEIIIGKDIR